MVQSGDNRHSVSCFGTVCSSKSITGARIYRRCTENRAPNLNKRGKLQLPSCKTAYDPLLTGPSKKAKKKNLKGEERERNLLQMQIESWDLFRSQEAVCGYSYFI